jgi:hypothetical protein
MKLPRMRMSVRLLMTLILAFGCTFGWIIHRARVQHDAVAAIERVGGKVTYEYEFEGEGHISKIARTWRKKLARIVGLDYACNVNAVQIIDISSKSVISDAEVAAIGRLSYLEHLDLIVLRDARYDLSSLARLTRLKSVQLAFFPIDDDDLAHLSGLKRLKHLRIEPSGGSKITDTGLANLANLRDLRALSIYSPMITDAGIVHLSGMGQLEYLRLHRGRGLPDLGR